MKTLIIISLIIIQPYSHPFEQDLKEAIKILYQEKATVLNIKSTSVTEGNEVLSIIFPELIRWSALSDIFETAALELLYVQKGSESANFSIGHFQMKPSFIEDIENYVDTHPNLSTFNYIVICNKPEKEVRKERLQRMKQLDWQLRYAHVFWLVAQDKFKHRTFKNKQERVRFYATAYNYGFLRPENEIESRLHRKTFPFGINYAGEQVAYGDLAVEFYTKYADQF